MRGCWPIPIVVLLCGTGCALVPIPVARTLPDQFAEVALRDAADGAPVDGATVNVFGDRFTNWKRFFPPHCTTNYSTPAKDSVVLVVSPKGDGRYVIERRRVFRKIRPWGIGPLGTAIHQDYACTVSAKAAGFIPMTVVMPPVGGSADTLSHGRQVQEPFPASLSSNGVLTIRMNTETAEQQGGGSLPPAARSPKPTP